MNTTIEDTARRPAAAERRPAPEGWCYQCGYAPCVSRRGRCSGGRPWTLPTWANIIAGRIESATEGLEGRYQEWTQGQADLARAIAAVLIEDADSADRHRAERSSSAPR